MGTREMNTDITMEEKEKEQKEKNELMCGEKDSMYHALRRSEDNDQEDKKCRKELKRDIRSYFKCTGKKSEIRASGDDQSPVVSPDGKRRDNIKCSSWTVKRELRIL